MGDATGLLFEEFVEIDKGFTVAFFVAVLCVMVGLFILSHRQQDTTYYLLLTAYYSLLTNYYPLQTIH